MIKIYFSISALFFSFIIVNCSIIKNSEWYNVGKLWSPGTTVKPTICQSSDFPSDLKDDKRPIKLFLVPNATNENPIQIKNIEVFPASDPAHRPVKVWPFFEPQHCFTLKFEIPRNVQPKRLYKLRMKKKLSLSKWESDQFEIVSPQTFDIVNDRLRKTPLKPIKEHRRY